jgi:hypothetical protein
MALERKTQDYNFTSGLSNVNPAELPPEALEKYRGTLQQGIEALEKRYNEPNWYKVAAGFAKPQLGGFIASLGSAAEAAGDTEEQRREQLLPISQMKAEIERSNMLLGQKENQNRVFQDWLKKNTGPDGKVTPMDATTYSRITSLGKDTDVAKAAAEYYTGAKAGLEIAGGAAEVSARYPQLAGALEDFTKFQLNPNADPAKLEEKKKNYYKLLENARPTTIDAAKWAAMSDDQKQREVEGAAQAERTKGMDTEEILRQQANQAPERLGLLRSIRDIALGAGIPESEVKDGKKLSGQEQMALLLNEFGGNNPMEVFARAVSEGKGPALLKDIDRYARQYKMSDEAKNKFQVLVKLLAENQVSLRNSALNPTNAFSELQQTASPNIGNSQKALVTLVDLMGHAEKNAQERYNYAKENKLPYGQLERDVGYNKLRSEYAQKHVEIATGDPIMTPPSWYNPSAGNVSAKPQAKTEVKPEVKPQTNAPAGGGKERPKERTINGQVWVRQDDGSYIPKAQ